VGKHDSKLKETEEDQKSGEIDALCASPSSVAMLGATDLKGKSFLDAGCGSGLFSLVAEALGASVHSFDYDPISLRCALELRRRYFPEDSKWTVVEAAV
jgi:predicted RNA methylase